MNARKRTDRSLPASARQLARELKRTDTRIVFAESCTAGLVAASLAAVPGISEFLCGSAVAYQESTKQQWLGVSARMLRTHTAVSKPVAEAMVRGALRSTRQAQMAASITGHLGPNAPAGFDGVVFIGVARQTTRQIQLLDCQRVELESTTRRQRQIEAACRVMSQCTQWLAGQGR